MAETVGPFSPSFRIFIFSLLGEGGHCNHLASARRHLRYCSSLTFSIQSTFLPFSDSVSAICVIAVVDAAPCQCFSPGGNHTTSPGRTSSMGPPCICTQPRPEVMT